MKSEKGDKPTINTLFRVCQLLDGMRVGGNHSGSCCVMLIYTSLYTQSGSGHQYDLLQCCRGTRQHSREIHQRPLQQQEPCRATRLSRCPASAAIQAAQALLERWPHHPSAGVPGVLQGSPSNQHLRIRAFQITHPSLVCTLALHNGDLESRQWE